MDGVSVAASIVGIATAGIQVSIKVVTLAGQVATASNRVSAIGNDISLTSNILQQLGELITEKDSGGTASILNKGGLETTRSSAEICKRIFQEVEEEVAKASQLVRGRKNKVGEKVKLSTFEKVKWPFFQPGIETLRTDLREAKGTLMLMLQVASLAISKRTAILNASTSANVMDQKDMIRSMLILHQQQLHQQRPSNRENNPRSSSGTGTIKDRGHPPGSERQSPRPLAYSHSVGHGPDSLSNLDRKSQVALPRISKNEHRALNHGIEEVNSETTTSLSASESARESSLGSGQHQSPSDGEVLDVISSSSRSSRAHIYGDSKKDAESMVEMSFIEPAVKDFPGGVSITWSYQTMPMSESDIYGRLAKTRANSVTSVLKTMETLPAFERLLISRRIEETKERLSNARVNILSLERTEQAMQHGSLSITHVPSFRLIVQLINPGSRQTQMRYVGLRRMQYYTPPFMRIDPMMHPSDSTTAPIKSSPSRSVSLRSWSETKESFRRRIPFRRESRREHIMMEEKTRPVQQGDDIMEARPPHGKRSHSNKSSYRIVDPKAYQDDDSVIDPVAVKRARNTFAARKSRGRRAVYTENLEDQNERLRTKVENLRLGRDSALEAEEKVLEEEDGEAEDVSATEDEDGDVIGRVPEDDGPDETAAVDELLRKYTTVFEEEK